MPIFARVCRELLIIAMPRCRCAFDIYAMSARRYALRCHAMILFYFDVVTMPADAKMMPDADDAIYRRVSSAFDADPRRRAPCRV